MLRVVSLIPSATEIVDALGLRAWLVGRSHECDYPPGVERLPVLTEAKIDLTGTSREIDQRVRTVLEQALSVYRVFSDRLDRLSPDVILTQAQCEVCAVSLADVENAVRTCIHAQPRIVALEPNRLEDVWQDVARVAEALDVPARGTALVERLQARMAAIEDRTRRQRTRPRVACIEWIDPLMAAGNWMPTLVERAGGQPLFAQHGAHAPYVTWEALCAADPEVIVVMPCGFGLERTEAEVSVLKGHPGWADLQAVRQGHVYLTDGNHFFNRPGPRLVTSLEILAEILHPDCFPGAHRGHGWKRLACSGSPRARPTG